MKCMTWSLGLLPLRVLYSPLLHLRYESSVARCCQVVNEMCNRKLFKAPKEAENVLAFEIENNSARPPLGAIYVRNSPSRRSVQPVSWVYEGEEGLPISATIEMPEEDLALDCVMVVTMNEICRVLGVTDTNQLQETYGKK